MNEPRKPRSHGTLQPRVSARPRPLMEDRIRPGAFHAQVLTLFPACFPGPLAEGLTGRALKDGLWTCQAIDIRGFASDLRGTVDDTPAGGGPGMVMRPDVIAKALDFARKSRIERGAGWPVVHLSPRGRTLTQDMAGKLAAEQGITLLCGRYEGVDQRVLDAREVREISLGDYVLTGGELAAMVLLDAVVRLRPGVLGNAASAADDSFSRGLLEHPHYTRPQAWEGRKIPKVLLSGNHARIAAWRLSQAERLTRERRPDLWAAREAAPAAERPDTDDIAGRASEEKDLDR